MVERSMPLGRNWRSRPLVFSLLPRCHGAWGSQNQMSMLNRLEPEADPRVVFTEQEIRALKALVTVRWKNKVPEPETLHDCVILLARLGGYLARKNDRPPGNEVIWKGMRRLDDIVLGMSM